MRIGFSSCCEGHLFRLTVDAVRESRLCLREERGNRGCIDREEANRSGRMVCCVRHERFSKVLFHCVSDREVKGILHQSKSNQPPSLK